MMMVMNTATAPFIISSSSSLLLYPLLPQPFLPLNKLSSNNNNKNKSFILLLSSSRPQNLKFKCSSGGEMGTSRSVKELLSGMLEEQVEEVLKRQENKAMLDGLEEATERVELLKRELAEIEKQEVEAKKMKLYINQLQTRASEIEECQKEILEAREMVEEAERSLAVDGVGGRAALTEDESKAIVKNQERLESIKAASISAIVGTLAGSPIALTQMTSISDLILPTAITLISCALYGVTYRYVIRRDLDDIHLKTGAAAAFGLVKGLAILGGGPPLELNVDSLLSHAYDGAVSVSQNLLIFLFATVALDFCIKLRILSPFPIKMSD